MNHDENFFLVRRDLLSETILKTVEAKRLIDSGEVDTIFEAVRRVGISRSAFYKYKDGVFPMNAILKERIIVISMNLEHRTGVLSRVLKYIADTGSNVLTINQSIPLQEIAHVTMSIDTATMTISLDELITGMNHLDGVTKATLIGHS